MRRLAIALVLLGRVARAQPVPDEEAPVPEAEPSQKPPAAPPQVTEDTVQRLDEVEDRVRELEHLEHRYDTLRDQVNSLLPLLAYINAYIDVGAFAVGGNGAGIRPDIGHLHFPQYAGRIAGEWVFMGDPLATMINSNGDPADASISREEPNDKIKSGGHPTALVNSIGMTLARYVGHGVSLASLVEFLPRPGGDTLDVELAHVDWRPTEQYDLVLSAGKIDPVLGIEYRNQDAPRRLGITPSLLCRYLCGRTYGISGRLVRGPLSVSAAVMNGDSFEQTIEQDHASADMHPMASGHLQWTFPVGQGLELGVSGAYGQQDAQSSDKTHQWHYGFDARLTNLAGFDLSAEFIHGRQRGLTSSEIDGGVACDAAPCLHYKAAYVMASRPLAAWVTPYIRYDWRSAVHQSGVDFVYESHVARVTVGGHFEMTHRIIGKIEYSFVRELGSTPEIPDDVLTASVVVVAN